ncbi:MAG: hydrolase [Deltaproteobacteria bacterium]|nr:hydrolase [Deltaproteobacteria bacterium]
METASHASREHTPVAEVITARALTPAIMAQADEIERVRRLPADLAHQLAEAGLFRIAQPRVYGGAELHPSDIARVIEEVSRADGSVGWCVMIAAVTATLAALLPDHWARDIYGTNPFVITGGAVAPSGKAVPVPGGYRVTGRWQWGSGIQNCQWICGGALVMDGDKPRLLPSGDPELHLMVFAADQVEILDTWNPSGLRGTGSHDFQVRDALVPEGRETILGATVPHISTPLYRFPFFGLMAVSVCAVAMGIARRALDEFVTLASEKVPAWTQRPLAQRPTIQAQVGEAEAVLRSARAFIFDAIDAAWDAAASGKKLSSDLRRDVRLAAAHAVRQSVKAVDLMYEAGGGSAIHAQSPLQRCFRDVHVVTQHVLVNASLYEQTGRLYLGAGPASPLL